MHIIDQIDIIFKAISRFSFSVCAELGQHIFSYEAWLSPGLIFSVQIMLVAYYVYECAWATRMMNVWANISFRSLLQLYCLYSTSVNKLSNGRRGLQQTHTHVLESCSVLDGDNW